MRLGSAAIACGSDGRMNAGSTTTAGSPEAAKRADQASGSSPSSCHSSSKPASAKARSASSQTCVQAARAEDVVAVGARLVGHAAHLGLAEDRDHPVDVVGREAPVALRLQVAERERAAGRAGAQRVHVVDHLPREELRPAAARLVVEEDPAGDPDAVRLAVAPAEHVRGRLRRGVRALRVEGGVLVVDDALARHRAEHLARRGLVEARRRAVEPDRVEQVDDDVRVRLPRRLRVGERRADAALAGEVVELLRPHVADERAQRARVADVAPHDASAARGGRRAARPRSRRARRRAPSSPRRAGAARGSSRPGRSRR